MKNLSFKRETTIQALLAVGVFGGVALVTGCTAPPTIGPDKQGAGEVQGAALGAGAGAVTGFQVGAGTGPGALVGAGVGAVFGGVKGLLEDQAEEQMLALAAASRGERERAYVHQVLNEHYKRRLQLHPSRDLFPADLFFYGDEAKVRPEAEAVVRELARMNKKRMPWSRIAVAAYVRGVDTEGSYNRILAERRAEAVTNLLARSGLEARRIEARAVVVDAPVLIDPQDNPLRYNQAIEIIALDR